MSRTESIALLLAVLMVAAVLIWVSPPPVKQTQSREALSEAQGRQTGGLPRRYASLSFQTDTSPDSIPLSRNLEQRLAAVRARNPDFNHRAFLDEQVPPRSARIANHSPLTGQSIALKMRLLTLKNDRPALQNLQDFAITCGAAICRIDGKLRSSDRLSALARTVRDAWDSDRADRTTPAVYVQPFSGPDAGRVSLYVSETLESLLPDHDQIAHR